MEIALEIHEQVETVMRNAMKDKVVFDHEDAMDRAKQYAGIAAGQYLDLWHSKDNLLNTLARSATMWVCTPEKTTHDLHHLFGTAPDSEKTLATTPQAITRYIVERCATVHAQYLMRRICSHVYNLDGYRDGLYWRLDPFNGEYIINGLYLNVTGE